MARPVKYTAEIGVDICAALAEGKSLKQHCEGIELPLRTVYGWLQANPEFQQLYARAREDQADTLADEILAIADEDPAVCMEKAKDGSDDTVIRVDAAAINRQRLRVDTRKWIASKMKPKKYGDRQTLEHVGADGGPIQTNGSPDQIVAQLTAVAQANPMVKHKLRETLRRALEALE